MGDCRNEEDEDGGERICCYFHPREMVIGVCSFCLQERLSAVASDQKRAKHHFHHTFCSLKKVFALTRFVNRVENFKQEKKSDDSDACSSSLCSQEDSFISIKFEANGVALWDKDKIPKIPLNLQCDKSWGDGNGNKVKKKSVLEHLNPRGMLRWRRRVGRFFNLFRWNKSKKENRCKRRKVERSKARLGWIRCLRKRRTNE
ncbi:uncharacterized protein LOC142522598 [Primulina tabacum]|uniref:uncharacterized protein LOC142522598 n=1 Tax=Primulina tabacum TaxID=48773 RepID=UPI003F599B3D